MSNLTFNRDYLSTTNGPNRTRFQVKWEQPCRSEPFAPDAARLREETDGLISLILTFGKGVPIEPTMEDVMPGVWRDRFVKSEIPFLILAHYRIVTDTFVVLLIAEVDSSLEAQKRFTITP